MRRYQRRVGIAAILLLCVFYLPADSRQASPVTKGFRDESLAIIDKILLAATAMPSEQYSFKPTPNQKSFAEILANLRDGTRRICSEIGRDSARLPCVAGQK